MGEAECGCILFNIMPYIAIPVVSVFIWWRLVMPFNWTSNLGRPVNVGRFTPHGNNWWFAQVRQKHLHNSMVWKHRPIKLDITNIWLDFWRKKEIVLDGGPSACGIGWI